MTTNQAAAVQNEIRAYMRARVVGAVNAAWRLLQSLHVSITFTVEGLAIHLEGERTFLSQSPKQIHNASQPSILERYFEQPSVYVNLSYFAYYEKVRLYRSIPACVLHQVNNDSSQVPSHEFDTPMYAVK